MGRPPSGPRVRLDDEHGDIYQFSFTVHGIRKKGSTHERDHAKAQAEADRRYALALLGKKPPPKRRAVKRPAATEDLTELFAGFIASLTGKKSDSYIRKLESHFAAHFAHRWRTLEEIIKPGSVDAYASDRLAGKSPAVEIKKVAKRPAKGSSVTVHKELVSLRRFLKWAKKMGHIDDLPAIEPVSQVSDYAPPDYSPEDARALLAALPDRHTHRHRRPVREFFTASWSQASRPGEIESLRRCDVNIDRREMTIRQSEDKARVGRTVSLSDEALAVFDSLFAEKTYAPHALIFGAANYRASLRKAAKACGLPRPTRHNLRHFRLTELGHLPGTSPAALQFLAGHKHMSTTDKYIRSRTKATRDLFARAVEFRRDSGAKLPSAPGKVLPDSAPVKARSRRRNART